MKVLKRDLRYCYICKETRWHTRKKLDAEFKCVWCEEHGMATSSNEDVPKESGSIANADTCKQSMEDAE